MRSLAARGVARPPRQHASSGYGFMRSYVELACKTYWKDEKKRGEGHRVYPSDPEREKTNEFIRMVKRERERETSGSTNEFIGKTTTMNKV